MSCVVTSTTAVIARHFIFEREPSWSDNQPHEQALHIGREEQLPFSKKRPGEGKPSAGTGCGWLESHNKRCRPWYHQNSNTSGGKDDTNDEHAHSADLWDTAWHIHVAELREEGYFGWWCHVHQDVQIMRRKTCAFNSDFYFEMYPFNHRRTERGEGKEM